jgi:hypothetical protein
LAKKRPNSRDAADDMSSWYDPVDDDATPDQVFFQEMERQRLINQVGSSATPSLDDIGEFASPPPQQQQQQQQQPKPSTPSALRSSSSSTPRFASSAPLGNGFGIPQLPNGNTDPPPIRRRRVPTMDQIKVAEATLSEYEAFMVSDNWLNEELQEQMWDESNLVQLEAPKGEDGENDEECVTEPNGSNGFQDDGKSEPWDDFGVEKTKDVDYERRNIMEVPFPSKGMYKIQNEKDPKETTRMR